MALVDDESLETFNTNVQFNDKETPFFENPAFFSGTPDKPTQSSSSCSPSYFLKKSESLSSKRIEFLSKRQLTFLNCKFCGRKTDHLLFNAGCTHECALTYYAKKSRMLYNFVFIEICKQSIYRTSQTAPRCIPFEYESDESYSEYWNRVVRVIYPDSQDVRRQHLIQQHRRFNELNNDTNDFDTVKKTPRVQHTN